MTALAAPPPPRLKITLETLQTYIYAWTSEPQDTPWKPTCGTSGYHYLISEFRPLSDQYPGLCYFHDTWKRHKTYATFPSPPTHFESRERERKKKRKSKFKGQGERAWESETKQHTHTCALYEKKIQLKKTLVHVSLPSYLRHQGQDYSTVALWWSTKITLGVSDLRFKCQHKMDDFSRQGC